METSFRPLPLESVRADLRAVARPARDFTSSFAPGTRLTPSFVSHVRPVSTFLYLTQGSALYQKNATTNVLLAVGPSTG